MKPGRIVAHAASARGNLLANLKINHAAMRLWHLHRACATAIPLMLLLACSPARAQTNFAVLAADGAWCWFSDPRALFHNGILYFGYVRAADGKTVLSAFDPRTGQATELWTSTRTERDDHNVPGLSLKHDRTMLAVYARHGTDRFFAYRLATSANPCTPADWGPELLSADTGAGVTYANPFQLATEAGRIYNFARCINYNPTVFVSTNGGTNWSAPLILIHTGTGGTRPYVKFASDYNTRIDFLYTDGHPRDVPNSLYHMYYQAGAFYKTDGTLLKYFTNLPILHDSGERGAVIYQYSDAPQPDPNEWIPTGRAWCWEIAYDTNGHPVCVFTVQRDNVTGTNWYDDRIYYYYALWTGTNWQKRFIAHAGRPLYAAEDDYAGGICVDPQDTRVVYISSNAQDPFNLADTTNVPLRANGRYELWRGVTTNGGLSFAWQQITSNSPVDNLRPYIPRRNGGEQCVLWLRGNYTSYTSFNCAIVGLFTSPVPQIATPTSGVWISDANGLWSDPTNWAGGTVANGPGCIADFSTLDITADRTVTLDSPRTIGTLRFGDISGNQNWGLVASNNSTLTLAGAVPTVTVLQNLAAIRAPLSGTNGLTKTGPGTLVLEAANALTGTGFFDTGSSSANDGSVRIAHPSAVNQFDSISLRNNNSGTSTIELDGTAGNIIISCPLTISCRNNDTPAIRNLAGSNVIAGPVALQIGGNRVVFHAAGGLLVLAGTNQYIGTLTNARSLVFDGPGDFSISGPVLDSTNRAPISLIKLGPGTLTINSACTYRGATAISNGTLVLNGSLASGHVIVANGCLTGTGTVTGAVTVLPAARLAPGDATRLGTLRILSTLTNQGTICLRLSKAGSITTNDALSGMHRLHCDGELHLTHIGLGVLTAGDTFKLFETTNFTGTFSRIQPDTPGPGLAWDTSRLYTEGVIAVTLGRFSPKFAHVTIEGTQFIARGTGGPAGYQFAVICSTNLALPLSAWHTVGTSAFDATGLFCFTNPLAPTTPHMFFTIRVH
ncbi:MAG: BNR-4 repeat-containing protein [Verrucomicrobiales bacterium]|nr:BNR-4 repeat-containing protein [Verrucomicrobiales bacterium]